MAAEPIMDNPLSPVPTIGVHYAKLLQDVKECITELKQEFDDSGGIPINDDIQPLHRLCSKLEYLLQAGLKAKTTLLGGKKDYWNYFADCLSTNKSLNDGIRFVKSISELHSNLGRGRAFLRFCLMHQRLADTLQHCVSNLRLTGEWFHPKAVWFDRKLVSELLNILYDLNDLQFDLSPRGYDLDASWPTFARRTFGSPYSWKPPSRTTSIASLSSIPAMENFSFSASPQTTTDPEVLKLQSEVTDARSKTQEVTHQLESAENQKLATELKLEHANKEQESTQKQNNDLENEVLMLKNKMETLREKCTEFEIRNDKLTQELKLKEEVWKEKEDMLKVQAKEAEKLLGDFKDDIQTPGKGISPSQKFDMMELRGQLVVQKKKHQALEINLKSTQMELDAKERVNQKKTELIDLLDRKLQQQKQKIDYLLTTAETLVKEKENQAKKLSSASTELMKLSKKYVDSEKLQGDLRKTNKELKAMLSSLEGKGQKLVGLAKDKVKSYTDQNKKLQDEVDDLKQEMKGKDVLPLSSNLKELEAGLSKTCGEILQQVSALVNKENLDNQGQAELTQIQDRLKTLEETKTDLSKSLEGSLSKEVEALRAQIEKSNAEREAVNVQIAALREENDKLKQEVTTSQGQGQSDSKDVETFEEQLKSKDAELEKVKSELGAIRSLVLQSVTGIGAASQVSQ